MQQHNRKSQSSIPLSWQLGFTAGSALLTARCRTLISLVVVLAAVSRLPQGLPSRDLLSVLPI